MIRAVIFDMDGVIIDSEMEYLKKDFEFAKKKNPDVSLEQLFGMVGASKRDAWKCLEKAVNNGQTWEELREEFHRIDVYTDMDYRKIFRPIIRDMLVELKESGFLLALASSTQMDIIERVLTENEIKGYFDVIVSGSQFERSKPDPEIYHYTAKALGVKEEECFVIEDSTFGITAAHKAGMTVAALADERFSFDQSLADFQVESLSVVLDLIIQA